jgi:hypothetical protein
MLKQVTIWPFTEEFTIIQIVLEESKDLWITGQKRQHVGQEGLVVEK